MLKRQKNTESLAVDDFLTYVNNIPDKGAFYYIEIFIHLPTIGKTEEFFKINDIMKVKLSQLFSMGHVFFKLCKGNEDCIIEKYTGFYPKQKVKALFIKTFIKGKFVNDSTHKFNASWRIPLTNNQFQKILLRMITLEGIIKYNYIKYNCTDFTLDIINLINPSNSKLEPAKPYFKILKKIITIKCNTPLGLFKTLNSIKKPNEVDIKYEK